MNIRRSTYRWLGSTLYVVTGIFLLFSAGCKSAPSPPKPTAQIIQEKKSPQAPPASKRERRSADYVVLTADGQDTYQSLARTYLGDEKYAYIISESNNDEPLAAGKELAIPLYPVNPGGLYPDGYQTIPVLCYHQFSHKRNSNIMYVSEDAFEQQMAYLKNNGFTVITMKQFVDFIEYRRRPPKKSVVITIDDGWKSAKTIAYPILKKYGFTAVLFVYSDLIKSNQNSVTLSWDELRYLHESGVFEVESHTLSHSDLTKVSEEQLQRELKESQRIINARTGASPVSLAYPYGVFNDRVVEAVKRNSYRAAFSVLRGSNAFYYSPFTLNRTMVKGEKIDDFKKNLETFRQE
jgi:peptidoglycan/xylan/chitin deacetylase (PgdA/CDA1 family)